MKNKIVGILICMLLIAAAVLPVAGTLNKYKSFEEQQNMSPINKIGEETVTLNPTGDAFVSEGYNNTNYGSETYISIQKSFEDFKNMRSYLQFDVSSIPDDATITGASLRLFCFWNIGIDVQSDLYGINEAIIEDEITWNKQPFNQEEDPLLVSRDMTSDDTGSWCEYTDGEETLFAHFINEAILVDDIVNLMVKISDDYEAGQYSFWSKDHTENIPELVVTYELTPPEPDLEIVAKGGFFGYTVTVTNNGTEAFSGNLSMTITTDVSPGFMLMGEEISAMPNPIPLPPKESKEFNLGTVIGFGPAMINVEARAETPDVIEYSGNTTGFVLLIFVVGSCEIMPDPIP